jgi:periplasmic protein TonB
MPRDLFGNVTRPSISIGNRKWYTVPVSLLSHSMIIATVVVLPILAAPLMPGVIDNGDLEYITKILPPPPPPPVRPADAPPPVSPNAAPLKAPSTITPETPRQLEQFETTTTSIVGGPDDIERTIAPPPVVVAPPPAPQKPLRPGGAIRQPARLRGADPVYPPIARAAGVQGIVIIEATIDADGRVVNARVLRSLPLLDQAALDAVRQWEYMPTMLNGVPVPVVMTVTVSFVLSR